MTAGFRRCHTKGLATDSALQGRLELRVRVDGVGAVTAVDELSRTGLNDAVVHCTKARVQAGTFDSSKGPTEFLLTISFAVAGR
jgi:hypothetical protein